MHCIQTVAGRCAVRRSSTLLLCLAAVLLLAACNGPRYQKQASAESPRPRAVRTVHPRPGGNANLSGPLTGSVAALQSSPLAFMASGRLLRVHVDLGDSVQAGQLLAELDSAMQSAQLTQAHGALAQAKANLALLEAGSRPQEIAAAQAQLDAALAVEKQAQSDHQRALQLFAEGVIARAQLDQAESGLAQARQAVEAARQALSIAQQGARPEQIELARAAVTSAEGALAAAQTQLGYTQLKAPAAGAVSARLAEPGVVLAAGTPVLQLAAGGGLEIHSTVPEGQLGAVSIGQTARVEFPALPGQSARARVLQISPQADSLTRGFPLVLELLPAEGQSGNMEAIKPGMVAVLTLEQGSASEGLLIPRRCVIEGAVFVVREGRAARQAVKVLAEDGELLRVSGLSLQDEVLLNGQEYVSEGEAVQAVAALGIDELSRLSEDE